MFTTPNFTLSTPVSTNFSIRFSPSFGKEIPSELPIDAAYRYLNDSASGLQKKSAKQPRPCAKSSSKDSTRGSTRAYARPCSEASENCGDSESLRNSKLNAQSSAEELTGYQPLSYSAWKDLIQGHSLNFIALRVAEIANPLKLFQPRGILVWLHLLGTLQRHKPSVLVAHYYLANHFGVGEACIRRILAELVHWGFIIIHRTRYSVHGKHYEMSVSFPKELSKGFKADLDKYRQGMPSQESSFSSAEPEKNFSSLEKNTTTLKDLNLDERRTLTLGGPNKSGEAKEEKNSDFDRSSDFEQAPDQSPEPVASKPVQVQSEHPIPMPTLAPISAPIPAPNTNKPKGRRAKTKHPTAFSEPSQPSQPFENPLDRPELAALTDEDDIHITWDGELFADLARAQAHEQQKQSQKAQEGLGKGANGLSDADLELPPRPALPLDNRPEDWTPSRVDVEVALMVADERWALDPRQSPDSFPVIHPKYLGILLDVISWMPKLYDPVVVTMQALYPDLGMAKLFVNKREEMQTRVEAELKARCPFISELQIEKLFRLKKILNSYEGDPRFPTLRRYQMEKARWEQACQDKRERHQQERRDVEARRVQQAKQKATAPSLVATLPKHWIQRIAGLVRNLKLSKAHFLELAYHVVHGKSRYVFPTLFKKQDFLFCMAIHLIENGRWSRPWGMYR